MSRPLFRAKSGVMVRAVLPHGLSALPEPDVSVSADPEVWRDWMSAVWAVADVEVAVRHASPSFARAIDVLLERPLGQDAAGLREAALSLLSYVQRLRHRPMPFGLFAGVFEGRFGAAAAVRWGTQHRVLARADGEWLAAVTQRLEGTPEVRSRLRVVANSALRVRGERWVLPWQQRAREETGTAVREVSVLRTPAAETIDRLTRTPVSCQEVAAELARSCLELSVREVEEMLELLISRRVLLTGLEPASTDTDPLGHVVRVLEHAALPAGGDTGELATVLREIDTGVQDLNDPARPYDAADAQERRQKIERRMCQVADRPSPLDVDVLLDADLTIPRAVAWEAEAAAGVLARVSPEPYGSAAWIRYRDRFLDRYGEGVLVGLMDLLDPHTGLGLPEDFHGTTRAPLPDTADRDRLLMARAQRAVAGGGDLVLDEDLITRLGGPRRASATDVPAHLELLCSVHAADARSLDAGDFDLLVRRVSRGWGHFTGGRFTALFAQAPGAASPDGVLGTLARRPTGVHGALPAQLAFPTLLPRAVRVTRTRRLIPPLISLSEFREPDEPGLIPPGDLAVICHQGRLHLVSLSRRQIIEAAIPHPLQIEFQTPTVARFVDELQRGQSTRMITASGTLAAWDWGAVGRLPRLPRVRAGRSVLSPATWSLTHTGLPGREASHRAWEKAFAAWREETDVPRHVGLEYFDTPLRLDLDRPAHRELLRAQLEQRRPIGRLTLVEAAPPDAYGWCGGRAHEVVVLLSSTASRRPSPPLRHTPLAGREDVHVPGASRYLSARLALSSHAARHALLADHLPALATALPLGSQWWLTPQDTHGTPHTLLTVKVAGTAHAGPALHTLGVWLDALVSTGFVNGISLVPYRPHLGLWGSGRVLDAVEEVWAADTAVVARQHAHPSTPDVQTVLTAASIVAITAAVHQDHGAGMQWLSARPKPSTPSHSPNTCWSRPKRSSPRSVIGRRCAVLLPEPI
ncbi:lantibiotic dehydratase [Streptomyces acidiscabies]|uniref:Lantibiotic dehydratase n=1 Tax=Streptomyces acidiscabies TaxID=42234 RepID=A0ABU4MBQ4_9ACTN|nr:lantibiotic dehydratase [Streptomyces acidiscabies]MDX3024924.1 lantibiotic dehydratase [Streptomyces acidiscabies]